MLNVNSFLPLLYYEVVQTILDALTINKYELIKYLTI